MTNKLYEVDFEPMWPVPCGLIISAKDIDTATKLAKDTLAKNGLTMITITEIELEEDGTVVFYESGDY